jgi:hypothetical protein
MSPHAFATAKPNPNTFIRFARTTLRSKFRPD